MDEVLFQKKPGGQPRDEKDRGNAQPPVKPVRRSYDKVRSSDGESFAPDIRRGGF